MPTRRGLDWAPAVCTNNVAKELSAKSVINLFMAGILPSGCQRWICGVGSGEGERRPRVHFKTSPLLMRLRQKAVLRKMPLRPAGGPAFSLEREMGRDYELDVVKITLADRLSKRSHGLVVGHLKLRRRLITGRAGVLARPERSANTIFSLSHTIM